LPVVSAPGGATIDPEIFTGVLGASGSPQPARTSIVANSGNVREAKQRKE
jgi:hypothetical protein